MKLRRTLKFHSLRKGKVRMTWNKYNLYNLSEVYRRIPNFIPRTFFQQKWTAKALTRAYHGEHIKEQKWTRMFDRRLRSVVDMNPVYMAHNDGAEQATGRGSGRDKPTAEDITPWRERGKRLQWGLPGGRGVNQFWEPLVDKKELSADAHLQEETVYETNKQAGEGRTPYMNMAFAPIERRIDVAIFRAMFASSTRQARNLVIHGKVKVNGQPMNHATYLLNPGDMFQVEPDAVMFATGKIKPKTAPQGLGLKKWSNAYTRKRKKAAKKAAAAAVEVEATVEAAAATAAAPEADEGSLEPESAEDAEDADTATGDASPEDLQRRLRFLARNAREVLRDDNRDLSVRQKLRMRAFMKRARVLMSQLGRNDGQAAAAANTDIIALIRDTFKEMVQHNAKVADQAQKSGAFTPQESAEANESAEPDDDDAAAKMKREKEEKERERRRRTRAPVSELSDKEEAQLAKIVQEFEDNPLDHSKPYRTPWEPRPYMSAFAFIPRYLEVNQNICAAVYLRHPVARQGMAEIPSPFPPGVHELAFNWYLRRR